MSIVLPCVAAVLVLAGRGDDGLERTTVEYRDGDVVLEGYAVWDPKVVGPRGTVFVYHAWTGHDAYVRRRADQLAKMGYLAFAADMYGKGVVAKDHAEARRLSGEYVDDRRRMRRRAGAAIEAVKALPQCDLGRAAAIGYCFGGTTVLEMARAGLPLRLVVSFHGMLDSPNPDDGKDIKARVLVCHGAEDRFVPKAKIEAFVDEMRKHRVDWTMVSFGGAVHGFTHVGAGSNPATGLAYDAKADRRSWAILSDALAEAFGG